MYTADERAEIITIQQAVIPQMTSLDIPVSPQNYAIWYRYVGGEDQELNDVIDVMLKRNDKFTEETMNMLHSQFSGELHGEDLEDLRNELQALVTTVYKSVAEISGESTGLSDTLVDSAGLISQAGSVDEIKEVISKVVSDTRQFGEKSAQLGARFEAAQEEMESMRELLSSLQSEVRRDELTGIPNRKAFDEMLTKQISLGSRQKRPFSLLMIDIDHFKNVNDTFGHLIGDEILKFMAGRIESRLRTEDMVARFGGEEFTAILPETVAADAFHLAYELCKYFAKTSLKRGTEPKNVGKVTISVGIAEFKGEETPKELLARADQALYKAKNSGRNQVQVC